METGKLLVFDCDGTLLDTRKDYQVSVNYALKACGLKPISFEEATAYLGYGTRHFLMAAIGDKVSYYDKVMSLYLPYYYDHVADHTVKYPGIDRVLGTLKLKGYRLAVASNKPQAPVTRLIQAAFPNIFDRVYGQDFPNPPKPDPFLASRFLKDFQVSLDDVAYFGDTEVDDRFAHNAHIRNLGIVTYGFRTEAFLKANAHPSLFIAKPEGILSAVAGFWHGNRL